jgi:linoleoyl-CoA desaturase
MLKKQLSFSRVDSAKFFKTLNSRVNDYFKVNNLKRTGNWQLWLKTFILFSMFF